MDFVVRKVELNQPTYFSKETWDFSNIAVDKIQPFKVGEVKKLG
jgi:hypothetical protein